MAQRFAGGGFGRHVDIHIERAGLVELRERACTVLGKRHPQAVAQHRLVLARLRRHAHLDHRFGDRLGVRQPRFVLDVLGSGYPGMGDVGTPNEALDGWAAAFFTLPVPKKPVLALRAGGKKLWGPFPYFDAAFLGGSESFRAEERQRWAGDASAYGTTELRVPLAKFPFIVPLDVGAIGFADMGRVYVNGQSPGGWHDAEGGGFWVGYLNPGRNLNVLFTNRKGRRIVTTFGFAF